MPSITRISPQKKKGFFNIFIDGKFAFGLDEETLSKKQIKEGQELSPDRLEELKGDVTFGKTLNRVLNFLSFRPRSKSEILSYLEAKVYKSLGTKDRPPPRTKEISTKVIEKLEGWGYLNDEEFARWLTEQRTLGTNPKGKIFLRRELTQKGVAREIIDQALTSVKDEVSVESLIPLLKKMARRLSGETIHKRKQKMLQALGRRGFGWELALKGVEKFLKGQ